MASSKNDKYEDARQNYEEAASQYTGAAGYTKARQAGEKYGVKWADKQIDYGNEAGLDTARQAQKAGKNQAIIADQYLQGRAISVVLPTDAGLVVYPGTLMIDIENMSV